MAVTGCKLTRIPFKLGIFCGKIGFKSLCRTICCCMDFITFVANKFEEYKAKLILKMSKLSGEIPWLVRSIKFAGNTGKNTKEANAIAGNNSCSVHCNCRATCVYLPLKIRNKLYYKISYAGNFKTRNQNASFTNSETGSLCR